MKESKRGYTIYIALRSVLLLVLIAVSVGRANAAGFVPGISIRETINISIPAGIKDYLAYMRGCAVRGDYVSMEQGKMAESARNTKIKAQGLSYSPTEFFVPGRSGSDALKHIDRHIEENKRKWWLKLKVERTITNVTASHYTFYDSDPRSASGVYLAPDMGFKYIAIDPRYYKYGTKFLVWGYGAEPLLVTAVDCGGDIKGPARIDMYVGNISTDAANAYGMKRGLRMQIVR